ncbi:MFS transporter [Nocardioides donggukensis]|uniref:MFS transporter n=1 Tax=Nocardioides donggukensis TaxID=2774019 RepID=A0A927K818_9ACTN|nr:MFS transporter [Nocardioides donggukensis]MBD8870890.1 MFS transporter [Nocardioides donggukensis]
MRVRIPARIGGPASSRSARLMAGASALTTLGALPPFLLGSQAVWIRADLEVGLGLFGAAVSAFFASAAVSSVLGGGLVDRLGRRRGLALAGALVGAGGLAVAGLATGPVSLLACMVLLGAGNAACQTTANLSMARALPPHRRGLGFGIKQSAIPLAIMLGGLAVPTTGQAFGWRSTFLTTGVVGLLVLLGSAVTARRAARRAGPAVPATAGTPSEGAAERPPADTDRPPRLPLVLCGLAITLASASANSLGAFVASWGFRVGLTASEAGLLMAAGSLGSIVVRVASGHRADRRTGGNLPVVAWQMYAGALCFVGLAIGEAWAVAGFGLLAFTVGWAWPGLLLFAVARIGRDRPAAASGVVQAGAFAGGAVGPLVFGILVGQVGYAPAWLAGAVLFVAAGSLILLARRLFIADLRTRPPRDPVAWGGGRRGPT